MTELGKYMNQFAKYVVQQSRTNLTKGKKNASKGLYDSLGYEYFEGPNSFAVSFAMEDYAKFVDNGVSGTEQKYNTPYSYKRTSNLRGLEYHTGTFAKYAKQRNLRFRDKKGRFLSYKTIGYILASSVKKKGIAPSLFFTKPFEKAFKRLPNEIAKAYALDLENFMQFTTK